MNYKGDESEYYDDERVITFHSKEEGDKLSHFELVHDAKRDGFYLKLNDGENYMEMVFDKEEMKTLLYGLANAISL